MGWETLMHKTVNFDSTVEKPRKIVLVSFFPEIISFYNEDNRCSIVENGATVTG
jgi:hypothetical protein